MITELLNTGAENAKTGRELATLLGCDIRCIAQAVERERRAGSAICASQVRPQGYFLAANDEELRAYCGALYRRAGELHKTRRALVRILEKNEHAI